eukprot:2411526-Pleurochrysis_carterae.AAC.1
MSADWISVGSDSHAPMVLAKIVSPAPTVHYGLLNGKESKMRGLGREGEFESATINRRGECEKVRRLVVMGASVASSKEP